MDHRQDEEGLFYWARKGEKGRRGREEGVGSGRMREGRVSREHHFLIINPTDVRMERDHGARSSTRGSRIESNQAHQEPLHLQWRRVESAIE